MFNNRKKQIVAVLCTALLCCGLTAHPWAVQTSASAAILMEADSGRVLYEQNADQQMLIASTTKIMTALVAIENCAPDDVVTVTQAHMAEGSSMYLKPGETVELETLLYGLMLCSGNDAALAIADHCGPGIDAFVEKMNAKAAELGMAHTSFANPNGLDDEKQYSTARDMAVLAAYSMENESFARIVSTKSITIGNRTMVNHNKLLNQYEGCIGLKTGFTKAAGRTLVSCAERNGMRLIAVTLKDGNDWADHAALFDYGFEAYQLQRPAVYHQEAVRIPVLNSATREVSLLFGEDFSYPTAADEKIECRWEIDGSVFAPVEAGAPAGEVVYSLNGTELQRVTLYYGTSAKALETKRSSGGVWSAVHGFLLSLTAGV